MGSWRRANCFSFFDPSGLCIENDSPDIDVSEWVETVIRLVTDQLVIKVKDAEK